MVILSLVDWPDVNECSRKCLKVVRKNTFLVAEPGVADQWILDRPGEAASGVSAVFR